MQRVLYLEDDLVSIELSRQMLERSGSDMLIDAVSDGDAFMHAFDSGQYDLVLSDNEVPGFSGLSALRAVRERSASVPFVFVCGMGGREREKVCFDAGADGFIQKDQLWRLPPLARRLLQGKQAQRRELGLERLVRAVKELSLARSVEQIAAVVRSAAREINGADGATFVLRDKDKCFYLDEDAIGPLWKGLRFPMEACVSGWAMRDGVPVVLEDIYADPRVPHDAYRPTFVKSMVMVPVRAEAPVAAIGVYWARSHLATPSEVSLIQALADSTSVAMENAQLYAELEQRVRDRTRELEAANQDLEAYSYSVAHDLRNPIGQIIGFSALLKEEPGSLSQRQLGHVDYVSAAAYRMNEIVDDLLRLGRISNAALVSESLDLSALACDLAAVIDQEHGAGRTVEWRIAGDLRANADAGLLRVVLQNLMSNAHKYSGRTERAVIEVGCMDAPDAPDAADDVQIFFVRDNGAGFNPEHASRLFTPFTRLHSAKEFPGTGIGLATCQRIIHRHGGRIWAQAAPGQGATFFFSLPSAAS